MPYTPKLDISVRFDAPAEIVWAAMTKRRYTSEWWPTLEFSPNVGTRCRVQTPRPAKKRPRVATGRVARVDPGHEFAAEFTSMPRGFDSTVTVTVTQLKHRTRVRFVESGLPNGDYAELVAAECRDGWRQLLGALADYLGEPRTIARITRHLASR